MSSVPTTVADIHQYVVGVDTHASESCKSKRC